MTGDGQVKPGFPTPFPYNGSALYVDNYSLMVRLKGIIYAVFNGYREYGVASNGYPLDKIHLISENGVEKPGWPVLPFYTDAATGRLVGGTATGFAFGDLDGDGVPELVAITTQGGGDNTMGLFAWHLDGTPMAGFPVAIPGTAPRAPRPAGDRRY